MLDLPVSVVGAVVRGFRHARAVGFPTANVELQKPLDIPEGTYCGWARVGTGKQRIPALAFYGRAHSIPDAREPRLEVHLLGMDEDIYGKELSIELVSFLRPNQRFDTDDALITAIMNDYKQARHFFNL